MTKAPRIVELSPSGAGGISVLALLGEGAMRSARSLLPRAHFERGALFFGRLELAREEADEVLVCVRAEDRVEIHLHGSPTLVREVRLALGERAGEPCSPPATQSELGATLLRDAASESAARILLDQAEGALARELEELGRLDDESLFDRLSALSNRSRISRFAVEPATVVLVGPANAGKSTLFNLLVGKRRASVSQEAGTTRDALLERTILGAYPVQIVDTAGERIPSAAGLVNEVELRAQAIAHAWQRRAELVLWLQPPGHPAPLRPDGDAPRRVVLQSLADLVPEELRSASAISSAKDPEGARARVETCFRSTFDLPLSPWEPGRGVVLGSEGSCLLAHLLVASADERRSQLGRLLEVTEPPPMARR